MRSPPTLNHKNFSVSLFELLGPLGEHFRLHLHESKATWLSGVSARVLWNDPRATKRQAKYLQINKQLGEGAPEGRPKDHHEGESEAPRSKDTQGREVQGCLKAAPSSPRAPQMEPSNHRIVLGGPPRTPRWRLTGSKGPEGAP